MWACPVAGSSPGAHHPALRRARDPEAPHGPRGAFGPWSGLSPDAPYGARSSDQRGADAPVRAPHHGAPPSTHGGSYR